MKKVFCGVMFMVSSICFAGASPGDLQEAYRSYTQSGGYEIWRGDAEELLSVEKLREHIGDPAGVRNLHIGLGDFLEVSVKSALFNGYWSPAWEQKAACEVIRHRLEELEGSNLNVPGVISGLRDILSFEGDE